MRVFIMVCGCFLMLLGQGFGVVTVIPESIDDHIYDPQKWLQERHKEDLSEALGRAEKRWGARILAVVLSEEPAIGAEAYARKLGRNLGGQGVWGVVLHIPGASESPWCVAERGEMVRWEAQEGFDEAVARALARANREQEERLRFQAACRELADELGFIGVTMQRISQRQSEMRVEGMDQALSRLTNHRFFRRVLFVGIPLICLLGVIGAVWFQRYWRNRRKVFLFPETKHRLRFQGPWSGGGNVMLRFTSRVSEHGSRRA